MKDEVTGEIYCVRVSNGIMKNTPGECTSTPTAEDTQAPTITIIGNNPANVEVGTNYVDLGASVTDNEDENLGIKVEGDNLDTSTDATYEITYTAVDQAGNTGTAKRTVIVGNGGTEEVAPEILEVKEDPIITDTTAPVISLIGDSSIELELNSTYTDQGATATDDTDGDITNNITVTSLVDTTIANTYKVTYDVTDTAGNPASKVTRTVVVVAPAPEVVVEEVSTTTEAQI